MVDPKKLYLLRRHDVIEREALNAIVDDVDPEARRSLRLGVILVIPIVLIIVAMSAAGILQGVLRPARDMLMRAVIPLEPFGKAIGMVATGAAVGGATAPIIFGWILDTGHASWLFYVLAACLVILIVTILIPKKRIVLG